ncbi:50S ribosome-binding GTPase [bacterium]|nr:50S ribosome-binding GTPase [bacterium]
MTQQPSQKAVFPPHIAPYLDVAAYLVDSRAPAATLWLDATLAGKELLLLTRLEQADPKVTRRWEKYFRDCGYPCIAIDSIAEDGLGKVRDYLAKLLEKKKRLAARLGIANPTLRMAALGVPNVGKSTFLNHLIGAKRFKAADKPGVTRGPQWVRIFEDVEVLDTPGILRDAEIWGRRKHYWNLLNLMPYDLSLQEETVELLRSRLSDAGWKRLGRFYKASETSLAAAREDFISLLELVAGGRGFSIKNDQAIERACLRLVHDFRGLRFGRVSLQDPDEDQVTSPGFDRRPAKVAEPAAE